ncbi:nucleotidyl transferase AbiEii/AbiGii toxin family protein [candidate division KSB1 bacterium]|nr:nucleotidyl transferase AbiEii/AbiGii toxin family protein [candidate division KSB1 bacterium]
MLPFFRPEKVFALKGGTAINFFIRDLPRLSVDIDLTYLPINERKIALIDISERLEKVSAQITKLFPKIEIVKKILSETKATIALIIKRENVSIKIEPNFILRGTVFKPIEQRICKKAEELFEKTMSILTLSFADLYGSKLCAALDRQHPRDLYDVHLLLKNEGITEEVRRAFIVYLISHPRPIVELLDPNPLDIDEIYNQEFEGMTFEKVSLANLIETRNYIIQNVKNILTTEEKQFIISFKSLKPTWELLEMENIQELSAVKWKLLNLQKMDKRKHRKALDKLKDCLEI